MYQREYFTSQNFTLKKLLRIHIYFYNKNIYITRIIVVTYFNIFCSREYYVYFYDCSHSLHELFPCID
jgi:hypothetical protein